MRTIALLFLLPLACFGQGFSDASAPFLLSTSSLRKGLAGYWRLEEASGTRYDCSKNGNHLTSNNSVGQSVGKQSKCSTFVKTSSQYLSIADNASLRLSTNGITISAWVNMTNIASAGNYPQIAAKFKGASNRKEYELYYDGDLNRFLFLVGTNATTGIAFVKADNFGVPTQQTWYFISAGYDYTNVWISVNNGTKNTTGNTLPVTQTASSFMIGADDDLGSALFFNGYIDEVGVWSRPLSDTEIARLYNSGRGTHFPWAHP